MLKADYIKPESTDCEEWADSWGVYSTVHSDAAGSQLFVTGGYGRKADAEIAAEALNELEGFDWNGMSEEELTKLYNERFRSHRGVLEYVCEHLQW